MNFSRLSMESLKENGERIYSTFRARTIPLLFLILMSRIPVSFIASLSTENRVVYAGVFSLLAAATAPYVTNMIAWPMVKMIQFRIFNWKYKPKKYITSEIRQLKRKMDLSDNVEVYTTNNPWISGPFCIPSSGKVFLPEKWIHPEQEPIAAISHEFAHILTRHIYSRELLGGIIFVFASSLVLFLRTLPIFAQVSGFAVELLVFTVISRKNELRADRVGANFAGPEGLISLFEKMKHESKWDDGSETHPSFSERINQLRVLLD